MGFGLALNPGEKIVSEGKTTTQTKNRSDCCQAKNNSLKWWNFSAFALFQKAEGFGFALHNEVVFVRLLNVSEIVLEFSTQKKTKP